MEVDPAFACLIHIELRLLIFSVLNAIPHVTIAKIRELVPSV